MISCVCVDLVKKQQFELLFWDYKKWEDFQRKCKYSKKIKIISYIDNTKYYD